MIRSVLLRNIFASKFSRSAAVSVRGAGTSGSSKQQVSEDPENLTHFGFETVKASEKAEKGDYFAFLCK